MSYENPANRKTYVFAEADFGTGGKIDSIIGPKGKPGRLIDYGILSVNEDFTGVTTAPSISIGDSVDPDKYGEEFDLTTVTITEGARTVKSQFRETGDDKASFDALMVDRDLPADTLVEVRSVVGTGGTPAGKASPYVVIDWVD